MLIIIASVNIFVCIFLFVHVFISVAFRIIIKIYLQISDLFGDIEKIGDNHYFSVLDFCLLLQILQYGYGKLSFFHS